MITSFVGVGSNLGDRKRHIKRAIELLDNSDGITVEETSSIYQTLPVGGPQGQDKFLNGVLKIRTSLKPLTLLKRLQCIESALMRERGVKNGPRTIDLDILTYGKGVISRPNLLIPHPMLYKRGFVLRGFDEIAPDFVHPLLNKSIKRIYAELKTKKVKVIKDIHKMTDCAKALHRKTKTIGFVPTMGCLHEGHLSLIKRAKKDADTVIVSIFVNPTQFGPREDFRRYPRNFKKDEELAKLCGADIIFYPEAKDIYPKNYHTYVNVKELTENLCGASRPGHFQGVTTIVAKLFNIVQPDISYFGQKDAQQAIVIKQMVKDLNIPTKIKILPIVREKDGLAMSSRNVYLSKKERQDALILYRSLLKAKELIKRGQKDVKKVKSIMRVMINKKNTANIDYVSVVDLYTLKDVKTIKGKVLIAVAVRIGKTRLIDNIIIEG